jgi:hypothetical protein
MSNIATLSTWTSDEIESLLSLSQEQQDRIVSKLNRDEKESLAEAINKHHREGQLQRTKGAKLDKLRAQSAQINKQRRLEGSTVVIPELSNTDRKKRKKLEADSEAWVWEMCGPKSGIREPFSRKFTSQQSEMMGTFEQTLRDGGDELILASRGEGKTSYLRCMVWKTIATGLCDFIAFIGATGPDAWNSADAIKDMMQRSVPFVRYYPEIAIPALKVGATPQLAKHMRATGSRYDRPSETFTQYPISFEWTSESINLPDVPGSPSAGAMLRFRGADSPIRGLNIFGRRPKVVAIDDLDTPETTNNPDIAKKIVDRVNMDIGGLGGQDKSLGRIMLATLPKSGVGVAHHFAETGFPFVVKRFKYLLEKPDRFDLWMEYVRLRQKGKVDGDKYGRKAHQFYLLQRKVMDAGAIVSNPGRFKPQKLSDGTQLQVSALQNYFDEWADKGEMFCRCELDNETITNEQQIESKLELGHVMHAESDRPRGFTEATTTMMVRGVDVRKVELHFSTMASDPERRNRVIDYNVKSHGTSETTVEQAEQLIYEGLCKLANEWKQEGHEDDEGGLHFCDLTLIDKGWMGSWSEDGERKTWAAQPVERFCMEYGLRRFLPAKGAPNYRSPAPADNVIVGDNWHMNRGDGAERACTEVIWNAEHWHSLVEGLFMLPDSDDSAFSLFAAEPGIWANHKRLAEHIREGSEDLADLRRKSTKSRKPRFRRDHWWDSFAMMLVARSVEQWFRENLVSRKKQQGKVPPIRLDAREEIGAR